MVSRMRSDSKDEAMTAFNLACDMLAKHGLDFVDLIASENDEDESYQAGFADGYATCESQQNSESVTVTIEGQKVEFASAQQVYSRGVTDSQRVMQHKIEAVKREKLTVQWGGASLSFRSAQEAFEYAAKNSDLSKINKLTATQFFKKYANSGQEFVEELVSDNELEKFNQNPSKSIRYIKGVQDAHILNLETPGAYRPTQSATDFLMNQIATRVRFGLSKKQYLWFRHLEFRILRQYHLGY